MASKLNLREPIDNTSVLLLLGCGIGIGILSGKSYAIFRTLGTLYPVQ
ncbi:MAG: hypothetical protein ACXAAT_19550 [Candidatus Hodarchaeales archaeon]|jgi:hypothetical protein